MLVIIIFQTDTFIKVVSISWVRLYCWFIAGRIKPLLVPNKDVMNQTEHYSGYVENKL